MRNEIEPKKTKHSKRPVWLLLLISAVLMYAGIGWVYAWNMHQTSQENMLQSRKTSVEIVEVCPDKTIEMDASRTKEVSFINTGTSAVFLRIAYSETWTNGGVWLQDDGTLVTKNWTSSWTGGVDWIDGGDGWYYYTKVLPAGGSTADILSSITFTSILDYEYEEGTYTLDFIAEVVQLSNEASVNTATTQTVFGRAATVSNTTIVNGAVTSGTIAWN